MMLTKMEKMFYNATVPAGAAQYGSIILVPILTFSLCLPGILLASIVPEAILVIKDEELIIVPLSCNNSMGKVLEMVPGIIKDLDCFRLKEKG
ncbi:MAG: hypothetical protein GX767_02950 [Firmicutes bacterium]|nr:hypothetical protein [Bacillota bacterium]